MTGSAGVIIRRAVLAGSLGAALAIRGPSPHVHRPPSALPEAELFAPGVISTPLDELDAAFMPDGKTVYYAISSPGPATDQVGTIVVSSLRNGVWTPPVVAPFSGRYSDYDPFVSPDGQHLFFISTRPVGEVAKRGRLDYDIWVVDRAGTGWGEPHNLGAPINSPAPEYYPSVASDGTLYFSTVRPDSKGHFNLYRSKPVAGGYSSPENLGAVLNGAYDNIDNVIAPDQSFIIFVSYGRPDALGNGDLYISFNKDGSWTPPKNLGAPINSVALDYTPSVSPDGMYLYWASNRGFEDHPFSRPLSIAQLRDSLGSIRNGNGNIYRIPLAPVLAAMR